MRFLATLAACAVIFVLNGSRHHRPAAASPSARESELQFGKLTMVETDLELIDDDPKDPFDFSIDHWNDQLGAGYSKNTPPGDLPRSNASGDDDC